MPLQGFTDPEAPAADYAAPIATVLTSRFRGTAPMSAARRRLLGCDQAIGPHSLQPSGYVCFGLRPVAQKNSAQKNSARKALGLSLGSEGFF